MKAKDARRRITWPGNAKRPPAKRRSGPFIIRGSKTETARSHCIRISQTGEHLKAGLASVGGEGAGNPALSRGGPWRGTALGTANGHRRVDFSSCALSDPTIPLPATEERKGKDTCSRMSPAVSCLVAGTWTDSKRRCSGGRLVKSHTAQRGAVGRQRQKPRGARDFCDAERSSENCRGRAKYRRRLTAFPH